MVTVDALRNTELFQDLSDETLRAITDLAKVASYEDGDSVYELGDDADDLYLVDSGRVRQRCPRQQSKAGSGQAPGAHDDQRLPAADIAVLFRFVHKLASRATDI